MNRRLLLGCAINGAAGRGREPWEPPPATTYQRVRFEPGGPWYGVSWTYAFGAPIPVFTGETAEAYRRYKLGH